jgi:triosephosphate isomerase
MYKTAEEARQFIAELALLTRARALLAVPFTALSAAIEAAAGTQIVVGAQNMHDQEEGAYTGEVSGKMLFAAGARFVILGHSERRRLFHETSAWICRKVKRALTDGLMPIVCVGETEEERELGQTEETLARQLRESLEGVELGRVAVAYEPVWAIGTGKTASPQVAQDAHAFCRTVLAREKGKEAAEALSILYGGSVKPENSALLMAEPDIDGALVGGASLDPRLFAQIIHQGLES